jgi:hypothetical protein
MVKQMEIRVNKRLRFKVAVIYRKISGILIAIPACMN